MDRQIKFRGKCAVSGEWVFGFLSQGYWSPANYELLGYYIVFFVQNQGMKSVPVDPKTIGQFIEIVDDGGVEMYEGDYVQFYKGYVDDSWTDDKQGEPHEIVYKGGMTLGFRAVHGNGELVPGSHRDDGLKYPWKWNVIGNKFDGIKQAT